MALANAKTAKQSDRPAVLFLSDLWGRSQSDWWYHYLIPLGEHFNVRCYNSCELAGIYGGLDDQAALHRQFVSGGIERAIAKLLELEAEQSPAVILGFSIGGTIAWRAIMAGLSCRYFCALSATRLRKETRLLSQSGYLIYGEEDRYRPSNDWMTRQTSLKIEVLRGEKHELYRSPAMAQKVMKNLLAI